MIRPFILTIFGATGDLAHKKLIPGLFNLFKNKNLPKDFYIIGFARRPYTDKSFDEEFGKEISDPLWNDFAPHLLYHQGSFEEEKNFIELSDRIEALKKNLEPDATHIFYLATPPQNYDTILNFLYDHKKSFSQGKSDNDKYARLVIEKPFGKDLETAKLLDKKLEDNFQQWQIFRVDHYLGKETVQNILVFRFANSIFEPVWNNEFIDHVQIHWSEEQGIDGRGNFWEGVGLLRDTLQNHLMQLIASVVMDMPKGFSKEDVRDARAKAISQIVCINPDEVTTKVVRGQYNGYLSEKNVSPTSTTETFVAMKFSSNNPRFLGVPIYVRAGKAMGVSKASISIVFRQTCHILFREVGCPEQGNILTFNIQPNEGITIQTIAKKPGAKLDLGTVNMHFSYAEQYKTKGLDAYQKILLDIFTGDQMLFNRSDELAASWDVITKILEGWEKNNPPIYTYEKGSTGPKEADMLIEKDGRRWL